MGLRDRQYMRDPYHAPHITRKLIFVLILAFLLESIFVFYGKFDVLGIFGLTASGIKAGKVWQLFTFQFLHSYPWPWHVLFNCLGLWFFGRPVEEMLGSKRFFTTYLLCGFAGGLLQIATTFLPGHADIPVVGASAGICGIVAIFCSLHPMQELTTWIYFLPVTIRARYFLMFLAGLSLFGTIVPFDYVAHAAHLGGIAFGVGYVRWADQACDILARLNPFKKTNAGLKPDSTTSIHQPLWARSKPEPPAPEEEFISKEVDPILEKISAHGIQSLTESERKTLEAARRKMERR